jgi:hypothetical protein
MATGRVLAALERHFAISRFNRQIRMGRVLNKSDVAERAFDFGLIAG